MLRKSENSLLKKTMLIFVAIILIWRIVSSIIIKADQKANDEVTSENFHKDKKVKMNGYDISKLCLEEYQWN